MIQLNQRIISLYTIKNIIEDRKQIQLLSLKTFHVFLAFLSLNSFINLLLKLKIYTLIINYLYLNYYFDKDKFFTIQIN